jgi:hypothetical protein
VPFHITYALTMTSSSFWNRKQSKAPYIVRLICATNLDVSNAHLSGESGAALIRTHCFLKEITLSI